MVSSDVHTVDRDWYNNKFIDNPTHCRSKWYVDRNTALLQMVQKNSYFGVLELAGGTGLMAEMFLNEHPECDHYVHTDWAPEAVKLARGYNRIWGGRFMGLMRSASEAMGMQDDIELIICTGVEHFTLDQFIDLMWRIRPGMDLLLSLGRKYNKAGSHLYAYETVEKVVSVFNAQVHIKCVEEFDRRHIMLYGQRRIWKF